MPPIPEADWKLLRQLHPIVLDRYCQRVLAEARDLTCRAEPAAHERYLSLLKLLRNHDQEIAAGFDDARRSTALVQLLHWRSRQMINDEEFARFSPPTREHVASMLELMTT